MSFYSRFAAHYEKVFPFRDAVYSFLRERHSPPDGRVLDVGCGPGHYCGQFAAEGARPFGIDLDAEMIRAARERHPRAAFRTLDMTDLGRLEGSFDLAFCIGNVAGHVDENAFRDVLGALRRLLRPSAAWILQTVNWDRILDADDFAFPPRELGEGDLRFLREYLDLSPSGVRFRTRLLEGDRELFHDEVRLFPIRASRYVELHRDAGFELEEHYGDFARAPFSPSSGMGSVLVFRAPRTTT